MTTTNNLKYKKVALITESLWHMGGANRVLDVFAEMFPSADIYALFGEKEKLSNNIKKHKIYFSFLNKIHFIKKIYRYTFNLWPLAIESFDLSTYDLVISSSHSVAHGVITPLGSKHLAYIHTPMRYAWDEATNYSSTVDFGLIKRTIVDFSLNFIRLWDVNASIRPDILISNSKFVSQRIHKYWRRDTDLVITPPVERFTNKIAIKRKDYFASGSPFEPNKAGSQLLEYASKLGFNLKVIGDGSMRKKLQKKYKKYKNITFLGTTSEKEKWKLLSNAKGYITAGVEDYGIFTAEAISCGTPVLAYKTGGSLEIVKERKNGVFFSTQNIDDFEKALEIFNKKSWNYERISKESRFTNSREDFVKKIEKVLVDNQ